MITKAYRLIPALVPVGKSYHYETALLCLLCDKISHNDHDIREHYCGACHQFLEEIPHYFMPTGIRGQAEHTERPWVFQGMTLPEQALTAVLLFHDATPWDTIKRALWRSLTGSQEATTKVLCDTVRNALARETARAFLTQGGPPDAQAPSH